MGRQAGAAATESSDSGSIEYDGGEDSNGEAFVDGCEGCAEEGILISAGGPELLTNLVVLLRVGTSGPSGRNYIPRAVSVRTPVIMISHVARFASSIAFTLGWDIYVT